MRRTLETLECKHSLHSYWSTRPSIQTVEVLTLKASNKMHNNKAYGNNFVSYKEILSLTHKYDLVGFCMHMVSGPFECRLELIKTI